MIERTAHAKINLALHITGQRKDGYHLLDSLVVFSEFGDRVKVSPVHSASANGINLSISGPFGEGLEAGANNLVFRAASALKGQLENEGIDCVNVEIGLEKNLPVASGIGGGSADAAAVLLALQELWRGEHDLSDLALAIGADVPMCLYSRPLLASGIGEEISLLENAKPLHLVLVNSGQTISTPTVFAKLVEKANSPIKDFVQAGFLEVSELKKLRNDLQSSAIALVPEIRQVLTTIKDEGAVLARMSGSGATCFGIFETAEKASRAECNISKKFPNWWCVATDTTVS